MIFLGQDVVCIEHGESSVGKRRCLTGAFIAGFLAGRPFSCDAHNKSRATSRIWQVFLFSLIKSPLHVMHLQDGLKQCSKSRDFQFSFWFLRSLF